MLTIANVLDAFNELGGTHVQPMALQKHLEKAGWHATAVVEALNEAIAAGVLVMTPGRSLTKP